MHIHIITVGKVKEKYIKLGIDEFQKRLQPYCTLKFSEVIDEKDPEILSEKQLELVKNKEGERLLSRIKPDYYVITLDIQGKTMTSEAFAEKIQQINFQGKSHLSFVIGGSNGLSKEILARANEKMSFSALTFPHQLMKLILLEQVYRAFKIQKREPYHK